MNIAFYELMTQLDPLFLTVVMAAVAAKILQLYFDARKEKAQELKIERIQDEAETAQPNFAEFFVSSLRAATERERLTMLRAESAAGNLAFLGTVLLVLSVLAPMASWAVYVNTEPLTPATVAAIKQLQAETGVVPSGDAIQIARDWHILLAGLSLGFLFVAAARGILRQEAQQRENFHHVGRRVAYYENLAWAVQVYGRIDTEAGALRQASERILGELIRPPKEETAARRVPDDKEPVLPESVENIVAALRK